MTKNIYIYLLTFWLMSPLSVLGQSTNTFESYFTNGKELMKIGKNQLAMQAFKTVIGAENPYRNTAAFLYAVTAYRENQNFVARDMLMQIVNTDPDWKQIDEVNLMLENLYLLDGDYKKAMTFASKIGDPAISKNALGIKNKYLSSLNLAQLNALLSQYPSDKQLAEATCNKIIQMPFTEQDRELLDNLVSVFELDRTKYRVDDQLKSVKKDRYHVAVMLPFMFDELKVNPRRLSNEFVIELYQGMLLAMSDLKSQGIDIKLHLYDTQKDSAVTAKLTQHEEMKHMDLIIGPLYPGPVKVVSDFAYRQKINMINPLSTNSEIVQNNPYTFLFHPTEEVTAKKLASYTTEAISNKNAIIFHSQSNRDSVFAKTYRAEIESQGFKVNYMEGIDKDNGKKILDILTNTRTIEIDASELDQPIQQSNLQGNLRIAEMSFLTIKPDSIGHVFIASNEPSVISNALTGLATRGDSIRIVGTERWLEHRIVSLEGLDKQKAILAAPTYFDRTNPKYESLTSRCKETFKVYPTKNLFIGYEMMMTTGKLLKMHGTLFQYDPYYKKPIAGEISQGVFFGKEKCNQIVPITTFEKGDISLSKSQ